MNNETWKTIEEYPDYQVSNIGRVKSLKFGKERILQQQKNKDGHYLVFETFSFKLKPNECVHHINEDKENNTYENLEKMPKSEHSSFHMKGENNSNFGKNRSEVIKDKISKSHKINNLNNDEFVEKVIKIKLLLKENKFSGRKIAKILGVSHQLISMIKNGKRWAYVAI